MLELSCQVRNIRKSLLDQAPHVTQWPTRFSQKATQEWCEDNDSPIFNVPHHLLL